MGHSIQEFLKKINSTLTWLDVGSVATTALIIVFASVLMFLKYDSKDKEITYIQNAEQKMGVDTRPFGSISGTTYTFSWCQNASAILPKNKIYFTSEEAAKASGRTLSKLCQK